MFGRPAGEHVTKVFLDYYCSPESLVNLEVAGSLSKDCGYFLLGNDVICCGRTTAGHLTHRLPGDLYDVAGDIKIEGSTGFLPFDLDEVIDNFRYERYTRAVGSAGTGASVTRLMRSVYYLLRPFMPVWFRKHLQRHVVLSRNSNGFPSWPVDCTVDNIFAKLLAQLLPSFPNHEMPFIWFWPQGYTGCVIMTHDVETMRGRDFCSRMMDVDESFSIPSSFQIVPEKRYSVSDGFLKSIRDRGFEINLHGLDHEGNLFDEQDRFREHARRINEYAKQYGALGFRSPVLYRNTEWFDALDFSYDMSVPNVGRLDPQPGGCCTVMPYFLGDLVELPLTCTQDYMLFHILGDYSIELWKTQVNLIVARHGIASFIVHPDYVIERRAAHVYELLLRHLSEMREQKNLWIALPKEVDAWWRLRKQMRLIQDGDGWRIEGEGAKQARVAYARMESDSVIYEIDQA